MSSGSQSRPYFIDTNIWLYAFIPGQDSGKSAIAQMIIQRIDIRVSSQVINEICVNLIKKARFDETNIQHLINSFYSKYSVGPINKDVLLKSSELRHKLHLSFWDSLIVSSALIGGAEILFTEDMTGGLVVENRLVLTNPFAP